MNKKVFNWMLMAALVCALTLSVTSCKDDDDNNGSGSGTQEEQLAEQSNEFWAVVGQLVGMTNATDDYQTKTFAPIIGEPAADNATVHRVMVNTMESAAERFESLVGLAEGTVTAETPSYTWTSDAVGTLIYTKSQDGRSLATVDVNIKQVPGLRQIVFLTPEQMGTNASEDSWLNCYYHFGDVIKRKRTDGVTEYWVCVRPSFDPEGKKKSYWATVSPLSKENVANYTSSNNISYALPTRLGQDDNQMENMAEMLYALYNPKQWEKNISDNPGGIFSSGIEIFQDFHRKNIKYFSEEFWERVAKGWQETQYNDKADLWELVFGKKQEEFYRCFDLYGLHLLYYGYKWKWSISNSLTLYEQVFTTKGSDTKSNMHNRQKRTISHDVVNKQDPKRSIMVNVKTMYTEKVPYLTNNDLTSVSGTEKFFGSDDGDMPHYIFRFATGEELAKQSGAAYNKKTKMSGFDDVYVYTLKYGLDVNAKCEQRDNIKNNATAGSLAAPEVGCIIGADGKFYAKKQQAASQGGGAVAMVVALSDKEHPLEKGTQYNGMAMSLKLTEKAFLCARDDYGNTCGLEQTPTNWPDAQKMLDGLAVSQKMAAGCNNEHDHPAVKLCVNYNGGLTANGKLLHNYSSWFMPTFGQWLVAIQALGVVLPTVEQNSKLDFYNANIAKLDAYTNERGLADDEKLSQLFWTCSSYDLEISHFIYAVCSNFLNSTVVSGGSACANIQSRPFILFEY